MLPLSDHHHQQRNLIRQRMRAKRRELPQQEQDIASHRLARTLQNEHWFSRAERIGLYLPHHGELSVLPAVLGSHRRKRKLYLPVVKNKQQMSFVGWQPGDALIENRFGIPEPRLKGAEIASLWTLDVLLLPLVAFDRSGNRLGMGGGFYDRLLAKLNQSLRRPRLVGVAYQFQEVDSLPVAPWDQKLDQIVTD
jgi:5-formyltetrahydrofolate cyclo-ligase